MKKLILIAVLMSNSLMAQTSVKGGPDVISGDEIQRQISGGEHGRNPFSLQHTIEAFQDLEQSGHCLKSVEKDVTCQKIGGFNDYVYLCSRNFITIQNERMYHLTLPSEGFAYVDAEGALALVTLGVSTVYLKSKAKNMAKENMKYRSDTLFPLLSACIK